MISYATGWINSTVSGLSDFGDLAQNFLKVEARFFSVASRWEALKLHAGKAARALLRNENQTTGLNRFAYGCLARTKHFRSAFLTVLIYKLVELDGRHGLT